MRGVGRECALVPTAARLQRFTPLLNTNNHCPISCSPPISLQWPPGSASWLLGCAESALSRSGAKGARGQSGQTASVLGSLAPVPTLSDGLWLILGTWKKQKSLRSVVRIVPRPWVRRRPYCHALARSRLTRAPADTDDAGHQRSPGEVSQSVSTIPAAMRELLFEPGRPGAAHSSSTVLVQAVPHASVSDQRATDRVWLW